MLNIILKKLADCLKSFLGAIAFYTVIPLPHHWPLDFHRVACWSPLIGIVIGGGLGLFDEILNLAGFPVTVRSALIVTVWIGVTGGLHLDGVIDTADGLGVTDPQRRLAVMQDSVTGAFGVMAAIVVIGLKTVALSELSSDRGWGLMAAASWGRWGQVGAIAFYPYLKTTGKGAFHKQHIHLPQDLLLGLIGLGGMSGVSILLNRVPWELEIATGLTGSAIALGVGFWLNHRFGGHTGDTYGAVVEWTEAFFLCFLTIRGMGEVSLWSLPFLP